jgi:hypothetical protein
MSEKPSPPTPPGPDGLKRHYTGDEVVFTPGIAWLDALVREIIEAREANREPDLRRLRRPR